MDGHPVVQIASPVLQPNSGSGHEAVIYPPRMFLMVWRSRLVMVLL